MTRREREKKRRILRERLRRRLQNAADSKGQNHFEIVGTQRKIEKERENADPTN